METAFESGRDGTRPAARLRDRARSAPSAELELVVPWLNLGVIFLVVYIAALAATLAPAVRASRIVPAEALRYE